MSATYATSDRRRQANRQNAARSTGPLTDDGKCRSSQNAVTHAAFAADLLQPGEDASFFHAFRHAILEPLAPQDALELCLAERVVSAAWRLRRLQAADHALALIEDADFRAHAEEHNDNLRKAAETAAAASAADDAATPSAKPAPTPDDSDPLDDELARQRPIRLPRQLTPGLLIARALRPAPDLHDPDQRRPANRTSPFERLLAAEHRLQSMLHRAHRELRAAQALRRARQNDPDHHPDETCPYLEIDLNPDLATATQPEADTDSPPAEPAQPPATEIAQNEPTCQNGSPATPKDEPTPPIPNDQFPIPSPQPTTEHEQWVPDHQT